jgi:hypothetical protein
MPPTIKLSSGNGKLASAKIPVMLTHLFREFSGEFQVNVARRHDTASLPKAGVRIKNVRGHTIAVNVQPNNDATSAVLAFVVVPYELDPETVFRKITNGGSKRVFLETELAMHGLPDDQAAVLDKVMEPPTETETNPASQVVSDPSSYPSSDPSSQTVTVTQPEPERVSLIGWSKDDNNLGLALLAIYEESVKRPSKSVPMSGLGVMIVDRLGLRGVDARAFASILTSWASRGLIDNVMVKDERHVKVTVAGMKLAGVKEAIENSEDILDRMTKVIALAKEHRAAKQSMVEIDLKRQSVQSSINAYLRTIEDLKADLTKTEQRAAEFQRVLDSEDHKKAVAVLETLSAI